MKPKKVLKLSSNPKKRKVFPGFKKLLILQTNNLTNEQNISK